MIYKVGDDLKSIRAICGCSKKELAFLIGIDVSTIDRIESKDFYPNEETISRVYEFAYSRNINLNKIKSMFFKEEGGNDSIVLFHGSKDGIQGEIDLAKSKENNDFGRGFYLGESFEQSASFVSKFANSSVYIFNFDTKELNGIRYDVDRNWMLTIAYFRNTLNEHKDNKVIKKLISKLDDVDYVCAPIADNRMFRIIDTFISGEITDEQCKHCLAATNLGYQYVIKSEKALNKLTMLENCYITSSEKAQYSRQRKEFDSLGQNKVKLARIEYRGKGKYIEEILK